MGLNNKKVLSMNTKSKTQKPAYNFFPFITSQPTLHVCFMLKSPVYCLEKIAGASVLYHSSIKMFQSCVSQLQIYYAAAFSLRLDNFTY